jgi:hypothetical protein
VLKEVQAILVIKALAAARELEIVELPAAVAEAAVEVVVLTNNAPEVKVVVEIPEMLALNLAVLEDLVVKEEIPYM